MYDSYDTDAYLSDIPMFDTYDRPECDIHFEEDTVALDCPVCGDDQPNELGYMGGADLDTTHYRCKSCGWTWSDSSESFLMVGGEA